MVYCFSAPRRISHETSRSFRSTKSSRDLSCDRLCVKSIRQEECREGGEMGNASIEGKEKYAFSDKMLLGDASAMDIRQFFVQPI